MNYIMGIVGCQGTSGKEFANYGKQRKIRNKIGIHHAFRRMCNRMPAMYGSSLGCADKTAAAASC